MKHQEDMIACSIMACIAVSAFLALRLDLAYHERHISKFGQYQGQHQDYYDGDYHYHDGDHHYHDMHGEQHEGGEEQHYYYGDYHDYQNYHTHGSLLVDDKDALDEFMAMDDSEPTVIAVFQGDPSTSEDFEAFKGVAETHSHLLRFAHTSALPVREALGLANDESSVTVLVQRPRLHHGLDVWAGSKEVTPSRFPGRRLYEESLTTWIFRESSPLVGLYDWRVVERNLITETPLLIVFCKVDEPGHNKWHYHDDQEQQEEQQNEQVQAWTFDALAKRLSSVAEAHRSDLTVVVADKRIHHYEAMHFKLHLDPDDASTGLGLRLGDAYYHRHLAHDHATPEADSHKDKHTWGWIHGDGAPFIDTGAIGHFLDDFYDHKLTPETAEDGWQGHHDHHEWHHDDQHYHYGDEGNHWDD